MSQITTRAGSVDAHLSQQRLLGIPINLSGALDDGDNTIMVGAAGAITRLYINIKSATTLISGITTGAALSGGVKLLTIPEAFQVVAARITGVVSLSAATATAASGELALGSVLGSGAAATLTSTEENIHTASAIGAIAAGVGTTYDAATVLGTIVGSVGNSTDIFLNGSSSATGTAAANQLFKGQISVWIRPLAHL